MNEVNQLVTSLLGLGLDIKKASKANAGVQGAVQLILADQATLASLEAFLANIKALPADFKGFGISDALNLLQPTIAGVEAIIQA